MALLRKLFLSQCFLLMPALSADVWAQSPQELQWCIKGGQKHAGVAVKSPPSSEQTLRGCSSVIKGGRLKGAQLSSAYAIRGVTYSQSGKLDQALQDFDAAMRLTPNAVELLNLRGMVQVERGEVEKGLQDIKSAIQKNPKFVLAHYNLGTVLVSRDDVEPGIEALSEAIKIDPKLGQAYLNRGWAYAKKASYDRAIDDTTVAMRLLPGQVQPYINRGNAYEKNREYDKAEIDYSKALTMDANNAALWNARCWVRALSGKNLNEALNDCNRALQLQPNLANALDSRAMAYLKMDRIEEALADYDAALRNAGYEPGKSVDPQFAVTLFGRGLVKQRKGDQLGAAVDIAAAKAAKPSIAEDFNRYGIK